MDTFNIIAGIASILGFFLSMWTLIIASSVKSTVNKVRERLVRRIRIQEIRSSLSWDIQKLSAAINKNQLEAARTFVRRIQADLHQLDHHVTANEKEAILQALDLIRGLDNVREFGLKSKLCELRDAVENAVKHAENLEKELAWSANDE